MAFLSEFKKAYTSLGAEISRSFDSSGFEEGQKKQLSESAVGTIAEKQVILNNATSYHTRALIYDLSLAHRILASSHLVLGLLLSPPKTAVRPGESGGKRLLPSEPQRNNLVE